MAFSVNYMEIVLLVNAVYLNNRQSDIIDMMLFNIPLEHLFKQSTSIFLWWHGVLACVWNRIEKITIIADNDVLISKKEIGDSTCKGSQHFMTCDMRAFESAQVDTCHMYIT